MPVFVDWPGTIDRALFGLASSIDTTGRMISSTSAQMHSTASDATSSHGTGPPLASKRGGTHGRRRAASTIVCCRCSWTRAIAVAISSL